MREAGKFNRKQLLRKKANFYVVVIILMLAFTASIFSPDLLYVWAINDKDSQDEIQIDESEDTTLHNPSGDFGRNNDLDDIEIEEDNFDRQGDEIIAHSRTSSAEEVGLSGLEGNEPSPPVNNEKTKDLTPFITSLIVKKIINGQEEEWDGSALKDGDKIKLDMGYQFPAGTWTEDLLQRDGQGNPYYEYTYQLPAGIVLEPMPDQTIYWKGTSDKIGEFEIDKDGLVHFKITATDFNKNVFDGTFAFKVTIDERKVETEKIVFATADGSVTIPVPKIQRDLSLTKKGTYRLSSKISVYNGKADPGYIPYGNPEYLKYGSRVNNYGLLEYELVVSTNNGSADKVTIEDFFTPATHDALTPTYPDMKYPLNNGEVNFKLVRTTTDGKNIVLEKDKDYHVDITEKEGKPGFKIVDLPRLEEGEKYTLTYQAELPRDQVYNFKGDDRPISNWAKAISGDDQPTAESKQIIPNKIDGWPEVKNVIRKAGKFHENKNAMEWAIFVNPNHQDLTGLTLKDVLPEGVEFASDIYIYPPEKLSSAQEDSSGKLDFSWDPIQSGDDSGYLLKIKQPDPGQALTITLPLNTISRDTPGVTWFKNEDWSFQNGRWVRVITEQKPEDQKNDDAFIVKFYTTAGSSGQTVSNEATVEDKEQKTVDQSKDDSKNTTPLKDPSLQKSEDRFKDKLEDNCAKAWNFKYNIGTKEKLSEFTIRDTVRPLTSIDPKTLQTTNYPEGSHYFIASELTERFNEILALELTGVKTKLVFLSDEGQDYFTASYKFYDFNGEEVPSSDSATKVKTFEIKIKILKDYEQIKYVATLLKYKEPRTDSYFSHFDLDLVSQTMPEGTGSVSGVNDIELVENGLKSSAEAGQVFVKKIKEKAISIQSPEKTNYPSFTTRDDQKFNYDDQHSVRFRLTQTVGPKDGPRPGDGEPQIIYDYLPQNLKFDTSKGITVRAIKYEANEETDYKKDENGNTIWVDNGDGSLSPVQVKYIKLTEQEIALENFWKKPEYTIVDLPDGRQELKITIYDQGNSGNLNAMLTPGIDRYVVYYDASYEKDDFWNGTPPANTDLLTKTYTNEAVFDKGTTDESKISRTFEVSKKVPKLSKVSLQKNNSILYRLVLNHHGQDLMPGADKITLSDQLAISDPTVKADLLLGTIKLYNYTNRLLELRELEKNFTAVPDESLLLSPDQYSVQYDRESKKFDLEFPDSMPIFLTYEYKIDFSTAKEDFVVNNKASLAGEKVTSDAGSATQFSQAAAATGSTTPGKVIIYKYDKDNNTKFLPGAEFEFSTYDPIQKSWQVRKRMETGKNGLLELELDVSDLGKLYRLIETKAPSGYYLDAEPRYFVQVPLGKTIIDLKQEMNFSTIISDLGIKESDVNFLPFVGGTVYVANEENPPVEPLPETGGAGRGLFDIAALVFLSVTTVYVARKKAKYT